MAKGTVTVLVPSGIAGMTASAYPPLMKSKPVEDIQALGQIVEVLFKQIEGMTTRQKEELLAELYAHYLDKSPRWLN